MSEKPEKVNMFEKASEDRRKKFIEENDYVADEIMQPKTKPKDFLNQPKIRKKGYNYYVEDRVDKFLLELGEVMGTSKSAVANQLLIMCIEDSQILKELAESNEEIKTIFDKFNKLS